MDEGKCAWCSPGSAGAAPTAALCPLTSPAAPPVPPGFSGEKEKKRKARAKYICKFETIAPEERERRHVTEGCQTWYSVQNCSIRSLSSLHSSRHALQEDTWPWAAPNTHTEPRQPQRRAAALPGPWRAVSVPEGRSVGSLPARLQDAGGGGGVALLQHRGVNVAQLGVGCGRRGAADTAARPRDGASAPRRTLHPATRSRVPPGSAPLIGVAGSSGSPQPRARPWEKREGERARTRRKLQRAEEQSGRGRGPVGGDGPGPPVARYARARVHARAPMCTHNPVCAPTCIHTPTCMPRPMCKHTFMCAHIHLYACMFLYVHALTSLSMHTLMWTHTRMHVALYTRTPARARRQPHVHVHTPTRMHGHSRARTSPRAHRRRYARTPRLHSHPQAHTHP